MYKKLLIGCFLLALFLRVVGISTHPTGFTPDEASFGYDAYSILKTGKDQWGNTLPLTLKSFGDYKLPLYTYISVPFVALLGLSEFSVRLPNAIVGSLAVVAVFYLVNEMFKDKKLAITSAFLLAVSPWHIPMSRGAFEANLTTLLLPLTLYFYLKGLKQSKYLLVAGLFFGLNLFSYHSARFITPIIFGLFVLRDRKIFKLEKNTILGSILAGVAVLLVLISFYSGAGARVSSAGIFERTALEAGYHRVDSVLVGLPDPISRFFNNKVFYTFTTFTGNYLSYFSPQFLWNSGPAEGTYGMVPGRGVLFMFEMLFAFFLVKGLFKEKIEKPYFYLGIWLLLAPIPASLAVGPGYAANRALILEPALEILLAIGAVDLWHYLTKRFSVKTISLLFLSVFAISFAFFFEDYWFQQQAREAKSMLYGSKEAVMFAESAKRSGKEVIVSRSLSEPHIFFAFFGKVDPRVYQGESRNWNFQELGLDWVDQMPEYTLNSFTFTNIDWQKYKNVPNLVLIGKKEEFPENVNVKAKIEYPNGQDAYWIVEPNPEAFATKK